MSPVPVPLPNLTLSERATYERAVRLWIHAAALIKAERFIRPTLGASVYRARKWSA